MEPAVGTRPRPPCLQQGVCSDSRGWALGLGYLPAGPLQETSFCGQACGLAGVAGTVGPTRLGLTPGSCPHEACSLVALRGWMLPGLVVADFPGPGVGGQQSRSHSTGKGSRGATWLQGLRNPLRRAPHGERSWGDHSTPTSLLAVLPRPQGPSNLGLPHYRRILY